MMGKSIRKTGVRIGAVGALAVAGLVGPAGLAITASAAAPTGATAASTTSCTRGAWESRVEGRPASFAAGSRGGDYIWHNAAGFHLSVTHRGDHRAVYTGEITASTPVHLSPVHLEHGDVLKLSANHRTIVFAFADHGYIDGVNFTTDCAASVTFSHLNVGDTALPADRVDLGAHRLHPAHVPFTVVRARAL